MDGRAVGGGLEQDRDEDGSVSSAPSVRPSTMMFWMAVKALKASSTVDAW